MCWGWQQLHAIPMNDFFSNQKGGHLQYLTNQGLILSIITMALSLLIDLTPSKTLKQAKRTLLLITLPARVSSLSSQPLLIAIPIAHRGNKLCLLDPALNKPNAHCTTSKRTHLRRAKCHG
jgi:hypothetical protein